MPGPSALVIAVLGSSPARISTLCRPPHLVGLIRPVGVRPLADAEDECSEGEVPEA